MDHNPFYIIIILSLSHIIIYPIEVSLNFLKQSGFSKRKLSKVKGWILVP